MRLKAEWTIAVWLCANVLVVAAEPPPDYVEHIVPIFTKYCTGCHNASDREGKLALDSFAELQKGGENGVVVSPGQADSSRLVRVLTGAVEPRMPPEGEPAPKPEEIALLQAWINAGARGPKGAEPDRKVLITPQLTAAKGARKHTTSLAYSPQGKLAAVGRFGHIEIQDALSGSVVRTLSGLPGKVNAVHFSADSQSLVSASGISGLYGVATLWNAETGQRIREFEGHRDILYDAELSPDGTLLATCSYDRSIILWNVADGRKLRALEGHNDAVYDVAFSPDGTTLATASGDKTVKVWKVTTGERLDTLSQPLGEQYVVTFSPDGNLILAGGADNRIRVWKFVSREKARINPLLYARFAHEGAVVALAFSEHGQELLSAAEDRTVKRWETQNFTEVELLEKQSDQVIETAFLPGAKRVAVGRLDGSIALYPLGERQPVVDAAAKPVATTASHHDAASLAEITEQEPNDELNQAHVIQLPAKVLGSIDVVRSEQAYDWDLFRFQAVAGQEWMIEVKAARQKSPLDSRIEILDAQGLPVPRVLLQAVRDSYFTFRGKDSDTSDDFRVFNWEEMEINEWLYSDGEVVKLWHYPRGPDSGFIVYPGRGKRRTFFDTTPVSHALGAPAYIVVPHPPGTPLIPNGLPQFTIYYENDDDGWRQWGSDSRLTFVAPRDGEYILRIGDARGFEGEDHRYEVQIRAPRPDFQVRIDGMNPTVHAGSGKEFALQIDRQDSFEGEIRIEIEGLPKGFHASSPLVVQPGQTQVLGTVNALPDAPTPTADEAKASKVFATAVLNGQEVRKEVGSLGEIKLGAKPKVLVRLLPNQETSGQTPGAIPWDQPLELTVAPGQTITAKVAIERHDFKERVPFGSFDSGRNLPHGVYVDNIGLNGLMIVEGESERVFFITAAKWVPDQTRIFHLQAQVDGNQTSWPVVLHVRRSGAVAAK